MTDLENLLAQVMIRRNQARKEGNRVVEELLWDFQKDICRSLQCMAVVSTENREKELIQIEHSRANEFILNFIDHSQGHFTAQNLHSLAIRSGFQISFKEMRRKIHVCLDLRRKQGKIRSLGLRKWVRI